MKSIYSFLLVCLLAIPLIINAQSSTVNTGKTKIPLSERLFTGGDFGLLLGDVTLIDISPILGYRVTDDWSVGIGAAYLYYRDKNYSPPVTMNVYGGSLFTRYYVGLIENLFIHGEYEMQRYNALFIDNYGYIDHREWITAHNILVGGGYSFPLGSNSSVDVMMLYNLNENAQSLYSNPIIRIGFNLCL